MGNGAKISIAMTTYNGEKYLKEQIDSLLRQSRPFDELIVCDDNSRDGTYDILSDFAIKDNRIQLFRNSSNIGFKQNFEKVLSLCSGDYICLCDQDDIWTDDHIDKLYNSIGKNMLACGDSEIIDANGDKVLRKTCSDTGGGKILTMSYLMRLDNQSANAECRFLHAFFYSNPYSGMSMMIDRRFLKICIPIPQGSRFHDSWLTYLALMMDKFIYIPDIINNYRLHGENVTGNYGRGNILRSIARHIIIGHRGQDRSTIIPSLEGKKDLMVDNIKEQWPTFVKYFNREKTFLGRIANLLFEIKNFNKIYS